MHVNTILFSKKVVSKDPTSVYLPCRENTLQYTDITDYLYFTQKANNVTKILVKSRQDMLNNGILVTIVSYASPYPLWEYNVLFSCNTALKTLEYSREIPRNTRCSVTGNSSPHHVHAAHNALHVSCVIMQTPHNTSRHLV